MIDYQKMIDIIDTLYPVENLFGVAANRRSNIRCPFHDERRPSAHIYPQGLYCFTEGLLFRASKIARALGKDPLDLYNELLESYGNEEKILEDFELKRDSLDEIQISIKPKFENVDISDHFRNFFEEE